MEYYNSPKKRKETIKKCIECSREFIARNSKAKYCCDSCRQNAYNDRNEIVVLKRELEEREIVIPGLELLLESDPDNKDVLKTLLLFKGKITLLKDKISKLQK